ncbi:MAG TPA: porin, partial [Pseudomonadales bacterium]|nr:porin [Pseudomonadales bacterium]
MRLIRVTPLVAALCLSTVSAFAEDYSQPLKWSGFATTGVSVTDNKTPYLKPAFDNNPNFVGDSVLGLQADYQLDRRVRGSVQMVARNVNDNFDVKAEWAYAAFQVDETTQARVGRLRIPAFLVSKYYFVGNSYLWARPNSAVYDILLFTSYSGTDVIKTFEFKDSTLTVQPFVGQVDTDTLVFGQNSHFKSTRMFGLALNYEGSNFSLRGTGGRAAIVATFPGSALGNLEVQSDAEFQSFGATYQLGNWEFISEYSGTQVENSLLGDDDSAYLTAAYHMGKYTPHLTFSTRDTDTIVAGDSDSVIAGVRYDYNSRLDFKCEFQHGRAKKPAGGEFQRTPERYTVNMLTLNMDL